MQKILTTDWFEILIPLILGVLFAVLYLIETLGYSIREAGRSCGVTAMGYSLHTQFGTLARMSTLIAMPIIGYLLDNNISVHSIIIIPFTTTFVYSAVMVLVINSVEKFLLLIDIFFRWYIFKIYKINSEKISEKNPQIVDSLESIWSVFLPSFFSFFVVVTGIFTSLVLASVYHNHRAMIMQSTVVFTSIGTFISILIFDPKISSIIDRGGDYRSLIQIIFVSRISAMLSMGFIVFVAYNFAGLSGE